MKYYKNSNIKTKYKFLKYNNKSNISNYYITFKSIFYNYKIYLNLKFNFDFLINNYKYIILNSSFNFYEYINNISLFEKNYINNFNYNINLFYNNCYYIITKLYDAINTIIYICKIPNYNINNLLNNNIYYKNKLFKQYNNFKNIVIKNINTKYSSILKKYIKDNF